MKPTDTFTMLSISWLRATTLVPVFAMLLTGTVAAADDTVPPKSELEQRYETARDNLEKIRELSSKPAAMKNGVKFLLALADTAPDALAKSAFEAACAAMIAGGDLSGYEKGKSRLQDPVAFEKNVFDFCQECEGSGKAVPKCGECGGTGLRRIPNSNIMERCPSCRGSGRNPGASPSAGPCRKCGGHPKSADSAKAKKYFDKRLSDAIAECKKQINAERRAREEEENRILKEEKAAVQRRLAEERRKREEEFAAAQRAKGLVLYNGDWMTPSERENARKRDRFLAFIRERSRFGCVYSILQIIGDGKALCIDLQTGKTFCLLFSTDSAHNRAIAEGDRMRNDLYWCGTYSYTTVRNAESTVSMFAIDLDTAIFVAELQGFDE